MDRRLPSASQSIPQPMCVESQSDVIHRQLRQPIEPMSFCNVPAYDCQVPRLFHWLRAGTNGIRNPQFFFFTINLEHCCMSESMCLGCLQLHTLSHHIVRCRGCAALLYPSDFRSSSPTRQAPFLLPAWNVTYWVSAAQRLYSAGRGLQNL